MDELIALATGERCKIMVGKRNYLLDAYRKGRLNYDKAIKKKLPISSGAIESLIRQVVNLRIKVTVNFGCKKMQELCYICVVNG
jgi:hypothetical protein